MEIFLIMWLLFPCGLTGLRMRGMQHESIMALESAKHYTFELRWRASKTKANRYPYTSWQIPWSLRKGRTAWYWWMWFHRKWYYCRGFFLVPGSFREFSCMLPLFPWWSCRTHFWKRPFLPANHWFDSIFLSGCADRSEFFASLPARRTDML